MIDLPESPKPWKFPKLRVRSFRGLWPLLMPTVIQGPLYVATETAQGVGGKQTQKIPPESVSTRQDGYVVQLAANVVQNNITIPNVDTTLRQIVLSTIPGMYGEIRVRAYGYILFSATSTLQDISLKLRQAGVSFVGANVENHV